MTTEQPEEITWIVTVTLMTGKTVDHNYVLGKTMAEAEPVIESVSQLVSLSLAGQIPFLPLQNPNIVYNVQHVVSVKFTPIESDDLEDLLKKSQQRSSLGFHLDKRPPPTKSIPPALQPQ